MEPKTAAARSAGPWRAGTTRGSTGRSQRTTPTPTARWIPPGGMGARRQRARGEGHCAGRLRATGPGARVLCLHTPHCHVTPRLCCMSAGGPACVCVPLRRVLRGDKGRLLSSRRLVGCAPAIKAGHAGSGAASLDAGPPPRRRCAPAALRPRGRRHTPLRRGAEHAAQRAPARRVGCRNARGAERAPAQPHATQPPGLAAKRPFRSTRRCRCRARPAARRGAFSLAGRPCLLNARVSHPAPLHSRSLATL